MEIAPVHGYSGKYFEDGIETETRILPRQVTIEVRAWTLARLNGLAPLFYPGNGDRFGIRGHEA